MNVLGLDLSLNGPGFCPAPTITHSLRMKAADGDRRLVRIRDAVEGYLTTYPRTRSGRHYYSLAVAEDVPSGPNGGAQGSLDRVHGTVREVLARYGVPFALVNLSTLKLYATGNGSAEKSEMVYALPADVRAQCANDDEADAWWLADMGRQACGDMESWRLLPDHQLDALCRSADLVMFAHGSASSKTVIRKCGHGYQCLVNAGRLLHPMLLDVCDKPERKRRAK